jgi:hypothetical protein
MQEARSGWKDKREKEKGKKNKDKIKKRRQDYLIDNRQLIANS